MMRLVVLFVMLWALSSFAEAATIPVCTNEAFITAAATALPGDRIVLCAGTWVNTQVTVTVSGTVTAPITITTASPGSVTFTGNTYIQLDGDYLYLSGIKWKSYGNPAPKRGFVSTTNASDFCKISEMAFYADALSLRGLYIFDVELRGTNHEVFNISFLEKTTEGAQLLVQEGGDNRNHWLHNLLFMRSPLGYTGVEGDQINGGESLQIGAGDGVEIDANDVRADHLFFDRASGEYETISVKGSRNLLEDIVMIGCSGTIVFRWGDQNQVKRAYIDNKGKRFSAGVRVLGNNNLVEDLFVRGTTDRWVGGVKVDSGDNLPFGRDPADGFTARYVTIVEAQDSIAVGDSGTAPTGVVFQNVIAVRKSAVGPDNRVLFESNAPGAYTFSNSVLYGISNVSYPAGATNVDPQLIAQQDGLSIPNPAGPAAGMGSRMTKWPVYRGEVGVRTYQVWPRKAALARTAR